MPYIFAITLFLSALLMFLVQPMIGKTILPKFGGTPAVWVTCMLYFQMALLAGYGYAHVAPRWIILRRQSFIHVGMLLLPFVVLPLAVLLWPFLVLPLGLDKGWAPPGEAHPIPWVLGLLVLTVGLPFFLVSTSAPLLQKWFAGTGHAAGRDPYFLYAASNLGSMVALFSYPALVEPYLSLPAQGWLWTVGYGVLVLATLACAFLVWLSPRFPPAADASSAPVADASSAPVAYAPGSPGETAIAPKETVEALGAAAEEVTVRQRLRWIALAFVPSSLMLGVTTYLTTDIAAIPLLWIIPLALYLLSFVIVFSKLFQTLQDVAYQMLLWVAPAALLVLILVMCVPPDQIVVVFLVHLAVLFVVALVCHGELARGRPATRYLTEFYLWMSVGGALGGLFNAILAPLLFTRLLEYPLVLVLACMVLPSARPGGPSRWNQMLDVGLPLLIAMLAAALVIRRAMHGDLDFAPLYELHEWQTGALPILGCLGLVAALGYVLITLRVMEPHAEREEYSGQWQERALDVVVALALGVVALVLLFRPPGQIADLDAIAGWLGVDAGQLSQVLAYGLPLLFCYVFTDRPIRFGMCVGAVLFAAYLFDDLVPVMRQVSDRVIHRERSFFGVLNVHESGEYRRLIHGTTLHGKQSTDPARRREALTYFHRTGPIGQVFAELERQKRFPPSAVVGLGTGTLASYAEPGQEFDFYEIDKAVERIARDPSFFTFLSDAQERGVKLRVVLGDARLQLAHAPDGHYGLIVVDAFSSDAIPVHLITLEALELYLKKLAPDGILAFHISNRYLDLRPVLGNLARELGLDARRRYDRADPSLDKTSSHWVILARRTRDFGDLALDPRWLRLDDNPKHAVWTDDYSNLLSVFDWGND